MLLLPACGGGDPSTSSGAVGAEDGPGAGPATVTIERSRFAPEEITVAAGGTVEWVNLDPFDHTVTARDDQAVDFDSGPLGQDETFTQQFEEPGTYRYFCEIHPTMRASVTVE